MRKFFLSLLLTFLMVASATFALAQGADDPSVPGYLFECGQDIGQGGQIIGQPCDFNYFLSLFNRVIKFLLYVVVVPLAVFGILRTGYIMVKDSDKPNVKTAAKENAKFILLGFFFTFGAYLFVKFLLDLVLGNSSTANVIRNIFK